METKGASAFEDMLPGFFYFDHGVLTRVSMYQTMSLFWNPRRSIHTTIMEVGPQNQHKNGLLGPNSIMVVYNGPGHEARNLEHHDPGS